MQAHANVLIDFMVQEYSSPIVGIEIHVESVKVTLAMIVDDDCSTDSASCLM